MFSNANLIDGNGWTPIPGAAPPVRDGKTTPLGGILQAEVLDLKGRGVAVLNRLD